MTAVPADPDALTRYPRCDVVTDCIDVSSYFMTWHTWILKPGPETFLHKGVAMANAACLNFHSHLPRNRVRDIAIYQFPIATGLTHLRCFHFRTHKCSYILLTSKLNVRLPVGLASAGDVWVSISLRGAVSTKAILAIR